MPLTLQFLDWSQPALPQAARWLVDSQAVGGRLDLESMIVAVPGSEVGRRLLELLVAEADAGQLLLVPPRIVTAGALPELLYEARKPFASDLTQEWAWVAGLREAEAGWLQPLVPNPPAADDLTAWLTLGQMLGKLHRELAADGLDCEEILRQAGELETFNESPRWQVLAELERRYLRLLDQLGLWDIQTARLFADKHREYRTEKRIVLVGMVDLNRSQRAMLDQVADRVTALVFAPRNLAARFDTHGCLLEEAWQNVPLGLDARQIEIADGPGDQADAVVRFLHNLNGKFAADEITIGVPDPRLVPYLRQRLEEAELPLRYGAGLPIERSSPYQLLAEAADYLERRRFRDLALLARHPALNSWLVRQPKIESDWLTALDNYYGDHLPAEMTAARLKSRRPEGNVRHVQGAIARLLSPLLGKPAPLDEWSQPILDILSEVYGGQKLDENVEADRLILGACRAVHETIQQHRQLPARLSPSVTGPQALRIVLRGVEGTPLAPRAERAAIELRGWLELPWDDAPALVVTGVNEGIVPNSTSRDLFLPDALRRRLKLDDNRRRYVRDAYALSLLAASRADLRIIAGRRTADGDPLVPSRLLLACDDGELARRVRSFLAPPAAAPRIRVSGGLRAGKPRGSDFPIPAPPQGPCELPALRA